MGGLSAPEVLIVGAGPTGLTLAFELSRRGVRARIIDARAEPANESRAIAVHARTLELFEKSGITDELVAEGTPLRGAVLRAGDRVLASASFEELDSRFRFAVSVPQHVTERVLAERVAHVGAEVERGVSLTSLSDRGDVVEATLAHADGTREEVAAMWVVGCDGARSTVRREVRLDFGGTTADETFWLGDVTLEWSEPADRISAFFAPDGALVVFPLPGGRSRIVATAPDESDAHEAPSLAALTELLDRRVALDVRARDLGWSSRFRVHCRQVPRYRVGRVFVAGDAAHCHSPLGGQGMNTGIQDALNLAWKLALVQRGVAPESLLDSYHVERHAVGADVLRATDVATRVATLRHPVARAVRDSVAGFLSSLEPVQQRIRENVAELSVAYTKSPIVAEHRVALASSRIGSAEGAETPTVSAWRHWSSGPRAGHRAPDGHGVLDGREARIAELIDESKHTLLLFDGRAATERGYENLATIAREVSARFGDHVTSYVVVPREDRPAALDWDGPVLLDPEGDIEHRYAAESECLYVIRPDLYVGYRSQPADRARLIAWLSSFLISAG